MKALKRAVTIMFASLALAGLLCVASVTYGQAPTNEELQRYAYYFALKPCATCYDLLLRLMGRGWKADVAQRAIWAYSNGWNTGYSHGCYKGQFIKSNVQVPPADVAQLQAIYQGELQRHTTPEFKMTDTWGMYQVGYLDGQLQGVNEAPACGSAGVRSPTANDFLIYFRSKGMNPCDPFGDLPINPGGWGPFGHSLFGPC